MILPVWLFYLPSQLWSINVDWNQSFNYEHEKSWFFRNNLKFSEWTWAVNINGGMPTSVPMGSVTQRHVQRYASFQSLTYFMVYSSHVGGFLKIHHEKTLKGYSPPPLYLDLLFSFSINSLSSRLCMRTTALVRKKKSSKVHDFWCQRDGIVDREAKTFTMQASGCEF